MGKSIENLKSVTRVGLDLAKNVFQVHAVDARGDLVTACKLRRSKLLEFFAKLPPCVAAIPLRRAPVFRPCWIASNSTP